MQEDISYWSSGKEFSYNRQMDQPRKLLLDKAESGGGSLKEWSLAIGKNETYLQQYIRKGSPRNLPEEVRIRLSRETGIPEHLLRGSTVKKLLPAKKASKPKVALEEYRFIGSFDQGASAGPGAFIDSGAAAPMHYLAFRKDWLREITSSTNEDLFVLFADGTSMEPAIHHGDSLLVDKMQRNPRKDGIYVFIWDGLVNVKRLTADPRSKTITISSDNEAHPSFPNASPDEIEVVGRVIWIGRKV